MIYFIRVTFPAKPPIPRRGRKNLTGSGVINQPPLKERERFPKEDFPLFFMNNFIIRERLDK
jgi:hypothetical protein